MSSARLRLRHDCVEEYCNASALYRTRAGASPNWGRCSGAQPGLGAATARERIDRYEVVTRVATGGMAELLLARETGIGGAERLVVLKRILPHLAEQRTFVEMFLREARTASRLEHPNVIRIYASGEHDDSYFIAMEYLDGTTIRELLIMSRERAIPLPLEVSVGMVVQAARGLHAAHELRDLDGLPLGLVHRDVSPHNLMVTTAGDVKLLDFGVAKYTEMLSEATYSGEVKGKFGYMSPEQCRGDRLDRRSDLFSLGTVLWELVTGRDLFHRRTELEMLKAITEEDAPSARSVNPDVPEAMDRFLRRALSRDPGDRPATAKEFETGVIEAMGDADLSAEAVAESVRRIAGSALLERREIVRRARDASLPTGQRLKLAHRTDPDEKATSVEKRAPKPAVTATNVVRVPSAQRAEDRRQRRAWAWAVFAAGGLLAIALGAALIAVFTAPQGPPVRVGWAPVVDPVVLDAEVQDLGAWLSDELDRPVEMVVASDYADLADRIRRKDVAFAVVPPLLYVRTQADGAGLEPLAVKEFDGASGSDGYLMTRGKAATIEELKGATFCFTDPDSTTGWYLPRQYLSRRGYNPDTFVGKVHWSGDHIQMLRDLVAGKCEAGATYAGAVHVADDVGVPVGRLRVLAVTGYVPQEVVCAGPAASDADRKAMTEALLRFDPQEAFGVKSLGTTQRITGFSRPEPGIFDSLGHGASVQAQPSPE